MLNPAILTQTYFQIQDLKVDSFFRIIHSFILTTLSIGSTSSIIKATEALLTFF